MEGQDSNQQNSQQSNNDMSTQHFRWSDFLAYNNHFPNTSVSQTPSEVPFIFPPNWQPRPSSFAFLHPSNLGSLPNNTFIPLTNLTEQNSQASQPRSSKNSEQNSQASQPPSSKNPEQNSQASQSSSKNPTGGFKHWTMEEDVELCAAWLRVSQDAITNTGQRHGAFWARVTTEFNSQMKEKRHKDSTRSSNAVIGRWGIIHPAVTKWTAVHARWTRNVKSGWNESQMESGVRAMYQSSYNEPFRFEECWKVLRDEYKWKTWMNERAATSEGGNGTSEKDASSNEYVAPSIPTQSDPQSTPIVETPSSVCDPRPAEPEIDNHPLISGPASKDLPHPDGTKKAFNKAQRKKRKFDEKQASGKDEIITAIMRLEAGAQKRHKEQDEMKCRRDKVLDQRYEHQIRFTEKDMALNIDAKETEVLKSIEYITDRLLKAYSDYEDMKRSSLVTPKERFLCEEKRQWVALLESKLAAKKLLLDPTLVPVDDERAADQEEE